MADTWYYRNHRIVLHPEYNPPHYVTSGPARNTHTYSLSEAKKQIDKAYDQITAGTKVYVESREVKVAPHLLTPQEHAAKGKIVVSADAIKERQVIQTQDTYLDKIKLLILWLGLMRFLKTSGQR